ncbi:hypothetical protein Rvan_1725 [Rhodomicrobium vannielii ATCC 17100]|jgi:hypothetical protein|uniref:DUF2946 domain-containing protein n=1 Tax=Rhodomicrobium vannielii (strain ATCC 17100 / DSM 162 / LMG 4299 / NCIMB 10020 / ATH 3.1.1) TaxID=648757 RepID=E3HYZ7_RHOVT|nr:hypothetical protein Rvan_1725 [Rhodomicrobium vannielii ATCC 17100]
MRSRHWICSLAIIGVLLHAGTLARHHLVVFGEAVAAAEQLAAAEAYDEHALCRSGAGDDGAGAEPGKKAPGAPKSCLVCLGLAFAHALPPAEAPPLPVPPAFGAALPVIPLHSSHAATNVRLQQSRAPPSLQA